MSKKLYNFFNLLEKEINDKDTDPESFKIERFKKLLGTDDKEIINVFMKLRHRHQGSLYNIYLKNATGDYRGRIDSFNGIANRKIGISDFEKDKDKLKLKVRKQAKIKNRYDTRLQYARSGVAYEPLDPDSEIDDLDYGGDAAGDGASESLIIGGKNKMGMIDKKIKIAEQLVEEILSEGGYEIYKRNKEVMVKVDKLLENYFNSEDEEEDTEGCCQDDVYNDDEDFVGSEYDSGEEPAYEMDDDKLENDINHVPNQDIESLFDDVEDEMEGDELDEQMMVEEDETNSEEYRTYFKSMLKKYGVSSPDELDDEKKKEFFNKVEWGWKSEKEKSGDYEDSENT